MESSTRRKSKVKEKCRRSDVDGNADSRTLHMSLIGIRDMSVLEEAPQPAADPDVCDGI